MSLSHIPVSGITHNLCMRVVCCSVIYLKIFLFVCCGGRGHVHVCRSQRVLVPLELKAVLNCWMRVLGTELWPSERRSGNVVPHCRGASPAADGVCLKAAVTDVTNDQRILPQIWGPEVRSQRVDSTIALCRPFLSSPRCWLLSLTHRVPSLSSRGLLTCLSS